MVKSVMARNFGLLNESLNICASEIRIMSIFSTRGTHLENKQLKATSHVERTSKKKEKRLASQRIQILHWSRNAGVLQVSEKRDARRSLVHSSKSLYVSEGKNRKQTVNDESGRNWNAS